MTKKDVQEALERDSLARLWEYAKALSSRLDGALFKKDVEPYSKLLFGVMTLIISTMVLAILKLILK